MGTVSTPGVPKPAPPKGTPPEGSDPALPIGEPAAGTQASARIRIPEKIRPLGPRVSTILAVIAVGAYAIWFVTRPPQRVPVISFPKYVKYEANLEQGSPRDCVGKGCLLVIVGTDPSMQGGIQAAVQMSDELAGREVETTFVVAGAALKECARVAHLFKRPVLLDPEGKLAKALDIPRLPYWVVYDGSGKVLHRGEEPMTASQVLRRAGL
jgi:hypothetical protein